MAYHHGILYPSRCEDCYLQNQKRCKPDGPIPAKICFVGEGPGINEERQSRGFVGPSGELLWKWAARAGIQRNQVWVTNASLCLPRKIKLKTGAEISMVEVKDNATDCCRLRLIQELRWVTQDNPDAVIVPIGKLAIRSLTDIKKPKIYAYRGSRMQVDLAALEEYVRNGTTDKRIRW